MKPKNKAKEKAIYYLEGKIIVCKEERKEIIKTLDIAIEETAKEIFKDIENMINEYDFNYNKVLVKNIKKLKQKYLK